MASTAVAVKREQVPDPATQSWIALVQTGILVGKYSGGAPAGARAATHLAVADGRNLEAYEVDLLTSSDPPIGTEVEPVLWGWKRIN